MACQSLLCLSLESSSFILVAHAGHRSNTHLSDPRNAGTLDTVTVYRFSWVLIDCPHLSQVIMFTDPPSWQKTCDMLPQVRSRHLALVAQSYTMLQSYWSNSSLLSRNVSSCGHALEQVPSSCSTTNLPSVSGMGQTNTGILELSLSWHAVTSCHGYQVWTDRNA